MALPVCTKTLKLNNGHSLPAVGYGTWQGSYGCKDSKALEDVIVHALKFGYRLIDTAQHYGVEAEVGNAIRKSGVPRGEITVVTKFWGHWHHDPAAALKVSLDTLGLEYVDVFLMHWPCAQTPDRKTFLGPAESPTYVETWKKMEALVGPQCRTIGVSNFTQKTLDVLLASAAVVPAVNQIELHALNPNFKLVPYCQERGIQITSWSTLGSDSSSANPLLNHDIFTSIAKAHACSPGAVSLAWAVQRNIAVIPKSNTPARIEGNIRLPQLTPAEMALVNTAQDVIGKRRLTDSSGTAADGVRRWQGWTDEDFGWVDENEEWLT